MIYAYIQFVNELQPVQMAFFVFGLMALGCALGIVAADIKRAAARRKRGL